MRIALVLLPVTRREAPSHELALTAAILRSQGHETIVLDLNTEVFHELYKQRMLWKYTKYGVPQHVEQYGLQNELLRTKVARVLERRPDVVVLKSGTLNLETCAAFARMIKDADAALPVVFTGFKSIIAEDMKNSARQTGLPYDYRIWGEDEAALPELLRYLKADAAGRTSTELRIDGTLVDARVQPVVQDLDALPFHDFSDFRLDEYGSPTLLEWKTSRSCTWNCRFCIEWMLDKTYRTMSGERIFEEFVYQAKTHPSIKKVRFDDATMNGDVGVLARFSELMAERPELEWFGQAMLRPEMTDDLLRTMKRARCIQINYGLESGSDKVLSDMKKQFTISVAEEVIRNTSRNSIPVAANVVVGFPTETRADFLQTIAFIKRNREYIHHIATAFPSCRIEKDSFLDRNQESFNLRRADPERWEAQDGENDYAERIERTRELCEACIEIGLPVGLHGRWIRNAAALDAIMAELALPGERKTA